MTNIFAEATKGAPPYYLVKKAYAYIDKIDDNARVLDLGAGSLRNSLFFAKKGFSILAIDKDKNIHNYRKEVGDSADRIETVQEDICKFLQNNHEQFSVILATHVIPFLSENCRETFFKTLSSLLVDGGVLVLTFWGPRDDFSRKGVAVEEMEKLLEKLQSFKILFAKEREYDGPTVDGWEKHWHVIDIVASNRKDD